MKRVVQVIAPEGPSHKDGQDVVVAGKREATAQPARRDEIMRRVAAACMRACRQYARAQTRYKTAGVSPFAERPPVWLVVRTA